MTRWERWITTSELGLVWQLALQAACGLVMATWYRATPDMAYRTAFAGREQGMAGWISGVHYWGAQVFFLHGSLHLGAMLFSGAFRRDRLWHWYAAIAAALTGFVVLVTGNLLPFDRHGVRSAVTEIAIAARTPLVGDAVSRAMAHGPRFGAATLETWYAVHRVLPTLTLAGLLILVVGSRAKAPGRRLWAIAALPAGLVLPAGALLRAPLGSAAGPSDYAAYDVRVNWYAWPMHAVLKAFDACLGQGWIGSAVLPGMVLVALVVLPWLPDRVDSRIVRRIGFVGAALAVLVTPLFGGIPAPLGRDDVAAPADLLAGVSRQTQYDAALVERGRRRYEENCVRCHGADGGGSLSGPDLRAIAPAHRTASRLKAWIHDPEAVRPGATMPGFRRLTEDDLAALAAFVLHLK